MLETNIPQLPIIFFSLGSSHGCTSNLINVLDLQIFLPMNSTFAILLLRNQITSIESQSGAFLWTNSFQVGQRVLDLCLILTSYVQ